MLYWIPVVIIYYVLYAALSHHSNESGEWRHTAYLFGMQLFAIWPLVARYSSNLVYDGIVYDFIVVMTFYLTLAYFGCTQNFTWLQWSGFGLAVSGLILMKVK